jgi:hypothetical protein
VPVEEPEAQQRHDSDARHRPAPLTGRQREEARGQRERPALDQERVGAQPGDGRLDELQVLDPVGVERLAAGAGTVVDGCHA